MPFTPETARSAGRQGGLRKAEASSIADQHKREIRVQEDGKGRNRPANPQVDDARKHRLRALFPYPCVDCGGRFMTEEGYYEHKARRLTKNGKPICYPSLEWTDWKERWKL